VVRGFSGYGIGIGYLHTMAGGFWTPTAVSKKRADTVGEFKSVEMGVPHMPAWKAKTLGNLSQERVLLEL
jgi:hypothetical protein